MEPSELEVLGRSRQDRIEMDQSDDLALDDLDPFLRGEIADRLERLDEGGPLVVGHVHRDLDEAAVRQLEPFRPHRWQATVALPNRLRDPLRDGHIFRPKVRVPRDEYRTCNHDAGARGRIQPAGP